MIRNLQLQNFKAFQKLDLELRPLTVILGPNNVGKSSILAALRLLAQTLESQDSGVALLLNGIMGDFGTYRDIVYGNHGGRALQIAFEIDLPDIGHRFRVHHQPRTPIRVELEFKYRKIRREVILRSCVLSQSGKVLLSTEFSESNDKHLLERIAGRTAPSSIKAELSQALSLRNFMPVFYPFYHRRERTESKAIERFLTKKVEEAAFFVNQVGREIGVQLAHIEYLGPMRVPPERTYLFSGERRERVGSRGQYTAAILAMDSTKRSRQEPGLLDQISQWLKRAGISSGVQIRVISDRHYEIRLSHNTTSESENLADVGYGSSQVLPVLVGGYSLRENSIFIVEEPEIHLHPRAQAELGDFYAELYERKIQCLIETHSEHLILRLQQHVAAGLIPAKDLCFYYVSSNQNNKSVTKMLLDSNGKFTVDWPGGFFPERMNEATELARIRRTRNE